MAVSRSNSLTRGKKARADAASIEGRLDEALGLFEQVCRVDPVDAEAWVKLALVQRRLGRLESAEASARRGVALAPKIGFAHHALAVVMHAQGRLPQAIEGYRRTVQLQSDFADAWYLLGCALRGVGQAGDAAASLERALALRPGYAEALGELGALKVLAGDVVSGLSLLERAAALQPDNVETQCNLAQALRVADRVPEAIATCRRALQWAPESASALAGLASLLERTGQVDEARECLVRAVSLGARHPGLDMVAANLAFRDKRFDEAAATLLELLAGAGLDAESRAQAELLLGQVYDQQQQPAAAFELFVRGKARKGLAASLDPGNDPAHYLQRVARLRALCGDELARATPLAFEPDGAMPDPIFLVGFPRSGTTLLEQMLDAHPGLAAMEERPAVPCLVEAFWQIAGDDPAAALARLDRRDAERLREVYFTEASRHVKLEPGQRLVDKLPLNTAAVPLIWRVFPNARFIFALRHPCDVVLSCFMQDFAINAAMAGFHTLAGAARLYEAVMGAWLHYEASLPLACHVNRYEDLIADVPGELRRLFEFLELPWDDAALAHTDHARRREAINTPSQHQVTQPIYRSAAGRWRRYADQMAPVLPVLQPFVERFGYDTMA